MPCSIVTYGSQWIQLGLEDQLAARLAGIEKQLQQEQQPAQFLDRKLSRTGQRGRSRRTDEADEEPVGTAAGILGRRTNQTVGLYISIRLNLSQSIIQPNPP